jgi:hypothetical protein
MVKPHTLGGAGGKGVPKKRDVNRKRESRKLNVEPPTSNDSANPHCINTHITITGHCSSLPRMCTNFNLFRPQILVFETSSWKGFREFTCEDTCIHYHTDIGV